MNPNNPYIDLLLQGIHRMVEASLDKQNNQSMMFTLFENVKFITKRFIHICHNKPSFHQNTQLVIRIFQFFHEHF